MIISLFANSILIEAFLSGCASGISLYIGSTPLMKKKVKR